MTRSQLILAPLLLLSAFASHAAITFSGVSANPIDGGTYNEGPPGSPAPLELAPPPSTCEGALLLIWNHSDAAGRAPVIVESGGQDWHILPSHSDPTAGSLTWVWARFNGTWSANPVIQHDISGWSSLSAGMTVFCPSVASHGWALDSGNTASVYPSPSSPYSVTVSGQTTAAPGTVSVALWTSTNASAWGAITGTGWINPGSINQWRNTDTSLSVSLAYKTQTAAGFTGDVARSQISAAGGAGWTSMVAFKEIDGPIKFNPGHYIGNYPGSADGCGGYRFDCESIKQQHLDRIAEICDDPYIRGIQVSGYLRAFEKTFEDYTDGFAALDEIVAAAADCNKHVMISLWPTVFGGYAKPGYGEFPAYVVDNGGTTGLGFYTDPQGEAGLAMRIYGTIPGPIISYVCSAPTEITSTQIRMSR